MMIVNCTTRFIDIDEDKSSIVTQLLSGIIYHFQNKDFGQGLSEVVVIVAAAKSDSDLQYYEMGRGYKPRSKVFSSMFRVDFRKITDTDSGFDLCNLIKEELMNELCLLCNLGIKKFDCEKFLFEFVSYFEYAIPIAVAGKYVSEGKTLNEIIKQTMFKRAKRL